MQDVQVCMATGTGDFSAGDMHCIRGWKQRQSDYTRLDQSHESCDVPYGI